MKILFLLVPFMLIADCAIAQSNNTSISQTKIARLKPTEKIQPQKVISRPQEIADPTKDDLDSKKEDRYEKSSLADWSMVAITIVMAIIAAVQAYLFIRQLNFMRISMSDAEKTAESAKRSADSALETIQVMKDTSQRQLRAYVFISEVVLENVDANLNAVNDVPRVKIRFRNHGQTPAYKVRHHYLIGIQDYPTPQSAFTYPEPSVHDSVEDLAPDATSVSFAQDRLPLTAEDKKHLRDGTAAYYVLGKITYLDTFGNDRYTTYRFLVGGNRGFAGKSMSKAAEGNEAT